MPQELKSALFLALLQRGDMQDVLVFTRTKHRADRLQKQLAKSGIAAERIHGNRSQPQRTEALAGFKSGKYRVLVATDIAARGIDIEALGHVVNFDVPKVPEDYIHRVGRTARAEAVGDAFTFVAPDEEQDLRRIEREVGRRLPRVMVPDFDYSAKPEGQARGPAGGADRGDQGTEGGGPGAGGGEGSGRGRPGRGGVGGVERRPAAERSAAPASLTSLSLPRRRCRTPARRRRPAPGSRPAAGRRRRPGSCSRGSARPPVTRCPHRCPTARSRRPPGE